MICICGHAENQHDWDDDARSCLKCLCPSYEEKSGGEDKPDAAVAGTPA